MVLFPGFETIDAMGPVEMLGCLEGATTRWVSLSGGVVTSAQGVPVMTEKMDDDAPEWTSSGITAGMDMALGFIAKTRSVEEARRIAAFTEYRWNEDAADDPFAK